MPVMKLGIMQPYFLPYIGYFQLINLCDEFILYDNIKYTKKGWINRNKIRAGQSIHTIQLPLKADSDNLNIEDRVLANNWPREKTKLINRIHSYYKNAPYFDSIEPLIHLILDHKDYNLYGFLKNSFGILAKHLGIQTKIIDSSKIDIDHSLKSTRKVIALCQARNADKYINSIGGKLLYEKAQFTENNIELHFIKCEVPPLSLKQGNSPSYLSILDMLMNYKSQDIKNLLNCYSLE